MPASAKHQGTLLGETGIVQQTGLDQLFDQCPHLFLTVVSKKLLLELKLAVAAPGEKAECAVADLLQIRLFGTQGLTVVPTDR